MNLYSPLLTALVGLLAGLAIGKMWERYVFRGDKWIDRRRARWNDEPRAPLKLKK